MIDFHGSTGYGQAFTDAIRGDWGGKPLEDLKLGLAAALKQYPWLDGDDACALGGSYGGFMINWIAGQWPDRFKCLVTHDGDLRQPQHVLLHRGAMVSRVGDGRAGVRKSRRIREVQSRSTTCRSGRRRRS